jgi:PAS domain S-box-containing protein
MAIDTGKGGVLDALPVILWTALPDGSIDFVNRRWSDYTGLDLNEARGWDWQTVIHPDDAVAFVQGWRSILELGEPGEVVGHVRRSDGRYCRFLFQCQPVRDDAGRINKWCGVAIEIERSRCQEKTARQREADFQMVVDSIPMPVIVTSPSGDVEAFNQPALDYLGKTFDELKVWKTPNIVHPDDLDHMIAAHQNGAPYHVESRHRRADGVYRWCGVHGLPLRDEQGQVLRWLHLLTDVDDRKRAEEALATSERNLRTTIDTIPALAWSARADGTAEFLNKHYLDYAGLTTEEARDWGWTAAVHPEDLNRLAGRWHAIIASGKPGEAEARLRHHNGEYRSFLFRVNPLHDEHGNIIKWYGVNTDVEDRKRSEESFRAIVETTPECVSVIARDGTVLRTNDAGAIMAGARSVDAVVGQNFFDFVTPEHREKYREFHEKVCAGEKGSLEFDLINARGVRRHMETHAAPLRDGDGSIVQLNVTRDMTARALAEEALRRSEAFLAEGQHLARMGTISWTVDSGDIVWSEQLYRIFEFEPGTVVTLDRIAARVHPEDMPLLADMVGRAQRGESDFEYQHRIVLPDQCIKYLHLIAHRARNRADEVEYIGAVLDITQRRISEQALEKLRSEFARAARVMSLGALTASIAHEVNQPLAGIITNASTGLRMLAVDPPNVEGARETMRRTIRDGNRAADVIARLRALFGKRAVTVESVDLNDATREVIALSSSDLQRDRVLLHTELADQLLLVTGDRVQIQQVIMNLLRNAADAMSGVNDRPRHLLVSTARDVDGQVRLSVRDAGIGFDSEGIERLFDAFYTTKSDGMGIGLSISRSIIERHNGRLWALANDDGPGATFSFSIPCCSGDVITGHDAPAKTWRPTT